MPYKPGKIYSYQSTRISLILMRLDPHCPNKQSAHRMKGSCIFVPLFLDSCTISTLPYKIIHLGLPSISYIMGFGYGWGLRFRSRWVWWVGIAHPCWWLLPEIFCPSVGEPRKIFKRNWIYLLFLHSLRSRRGPSTTPPRCQSSVLLIGLCRHDDISYTGFSHSDTQGLSWWSNLN